MTGNFLPNGIPRHHHNQLRTWYQPCELLRCSIELLYLLALPIWPLIVLRRFCVTHDNPEISIGLYNSILIALAYFHFIPNEADAQPGPIIGCAGRLVADGRELASFGAIVRRVIPCKFNQFSFNQAQLAETKVMRSFRLFSLDFKIATPSKESFTFSDFVRLANSGSP